MSRTRSSTGWSPEKRLWSELVRVSGDLSWKRVVLDSSRSHRIPKEDTGVYLICSCPPFEALKSLTTYTVLYAGQVKSNKRGLRTRFLEHIRKPNAKLRLFLDCYYPAVHFWFALAYEPSHIDALESLLIATFNPPCNTIEAPGSSTLMARIGAPQSIGISGKRTPTQGGDDANLPCN